MDTPDTRPTEDETDAGSAPFEGFSAAAQAVFDRLAAVEHTPVAELFVRLLSTLRAAEHRVEREKQRAERAEAESLLDSLTGLNNRRAWIRMLSREEERCRRHAIPANVIVVDLDDLKSTNDSFGHAAGDDMLRRAARTILAHTRSHDAVARLGGDEFGVLAAHCTRSDAEILAIRIYEALGAEGISASVGIAERHPDHGLQRAWEEADQAMYERKRGRRKSPDAYLTTGDAGDSSAS